MCVYGLFKYFNYFLIPPKDATDYFTNIMYKFTKTRRLVPVSPEAKKYLKVVLKYYYNVKMFQMSTLYKTRKLTLIVTK